MADQLISYANLAAIESSLSNISSNILTLGHNLDVVDSRVDQVDSRVRFVCSEVEALAHEFRRYVDDQTKVNNLSISQQRLIQLNQEIEKRFGHYDTVRRTTTGILQADDLGIVKKDTITTATEELMLSTPGYWLAPCLVALAAWINDQPTLAEKALKEAIRRDDEKTSLFWALVCRRADRKGAALKWTQRYLANQDEENLDRKTVIILDAFASGLLGSDSEGLVSKQMAQWLEHLAAKPGFVEEQIDEWSDAINLKKRPYDASGYTYLPKYSNTWPALKSVMEGAALHADLLDYFIDIFEQEVSTESLKNQLDDILTSLVSDFDQEEAPLRKEQRYHQFVVDFKGDVDRADQHMRIEESAFEEHKNFTQLLTDAAMKPESAHASPSTQKFAIALSKDWIRTAYDDVVAKNRMNIPHEIEINLDNFSAKTTDGQNEAELVNNYTAMVNRQEQDALGQCVLTGFAKFCLFGGIAIGVIGLIMMLCNSIFLGLIATIAGIGMVINYFSKKKTVDANRNAMVAQFAKKRKSGTQIIRATLAEVVDFRAEFAQRDAESQKVDDFLEQITPEQYVRKLSDSNRKIRISN
jgi:hypothetical protein